MSITILGIESSCDDTSASVICDGYELSNVIANQDVHKHYGGVVPELASRSHQQNIIPVITRALNVAKISMDKIDAIAFTRGPGLLGSLMVGASFSKGFSLSRNIPMIEINHLQAHILSHFIKDKNKEYPGFPFLCLLVSGGHTQIVVVKDYLCMEIIGESIDDAAGEAFDKCAKVIGLPYPGGHHVDRLAKGGDGNAYTYNKPRIPELDYSFSGFKTSFLYNTRDSVKADPEFITKNQSDICASIQKTIVDILLEKLFIAAKRENIDQIAIAGGVSANSGLQNTLREEAKKRNWKLFIPEFKYTTDNAAMVAITGYYKYLKKEFASQNTTPIARYPL